MPWALDSGGFSELSIHGHWTVTPLQYVEEVRRYREEIGSLAWAAVQDHMCEPWILARTGASVAEHQHRTTESALQLRGLAPEVAWLPVLQGWRLEDYLRHWEAYDRAGIDLEAEPLVGLGSVCRRQRTEEVARIVQSLAPLRIHAFGVKLAGLLKTADALASADSMAWSFTARHRSPLPGCTHRNCANCLRFALQWREEVLRRIERAERTPRQLCLPWGVIS